VSVDPDFEQLYAAHRQTLHAYVLGRTGDAELALDLLQDVFVRAWRNLASLDSLPPGRQRAWLISVARNLVVDHHRAQGTRRATGLALACEAAIGERAAVGADAEALEHQRLELLDAAIWRLPDELRSVLLLSVLDGRTSTEIGEALGRPAGTVRYQLAQARRRLALELGLDDVERGAER